MTFNKLKEFCLTLVLGQLHARLTNFVYPALKTQYGKIKSVWKNEFYNDFGIERIFRLFLAIIQYALPGLYVRHYFGKSGLLARKLGIEIYVLFKLFLPVIFLSTNLYKFKATAYFSSYMILETIIILASLIFLSNEVAKPMSYRRSLTLLFLNYIQICLDFAVIYAYFNIVNRDFFNHFLTSNIQVVYFSFVTSATVGYGDIVVNQDIGRFLVIFQLIIFFLFIGLFLNFFMSKVQNPTYFEAEPKYGNKNNNK